MGTLLPIPACVSALFKTEYGALYSERVYLQDFVSAPVGDVPWEKRRKESEKMSLSITKHPILIRAGLSSLSGVYAKPSSVPRALIVALHGGGNSAAIFDNTIPGEAGFLDTAASLGYAVLALDRPGYRASQQIAEDLSTFDGQIALLRLALTAAWEQYGAGSAGIVLLGQSFGGLIALGLAASLPDVLLPCSDHAGGKSGTCEIRPIKSIETTALFCGRL